MKASMNALDSWEQKLWGLISFILLFVYCELTLHIAVFSSVDANIIFPILFSLVFGSIGYLICSLFPDKANRIITVIFVTITVIYYETQLIYHSIFQTFMPLNQIFMGGEALGNFFSQTVYAIITNILPVFLLLLPVPILITLICTRLLKFPRLRLVQIPISLIISILCTLLCLFILNITNISEGSALNTLTEEQFHTDQSVKINGLAASTLREFKEMLFPSESPTELMESSLNKLDNEGKMLNSSNIDFSDYDDPLSQYLSTVSPTAKNEYTGIAKGYNLITICAEAFSTAVIDKELTPTLYKLSTNGIIFNNFYTTFANTTTNGEYTFCTGLLPDTQRSKTEACFNDSADNYLPLCLGNLYKEMGYEAYAYHNYYGTFYDRHVTHPNMGYEFNAIGNGLDMPIENPSSDLDMIKASMPDYINSKNPFHVYYMTYSGHYQYDWNNDMSAKNHDKVDLLPYNERVKAYIACQLELEYALEALMEGLEAAGQADRTVIVLTADHYPYGLDNESYTALAGEGEYPDFDRYHNSFICYIPGITAVETDAYCSTQDILPTILNIMGIEFDSRLLPGRDALSNAAHVAVLSDRSFICEDFRYNAATGEVISHSGKDIPTQSLEEYRTYVDNMFNMSAQILESDYYAKVYEHIKTEESHSILKFDDLQENNVYIESTVVFMVENGFMEPKSETEFGINDNGTARELVEVLFKMSTYVKDYSSASDWALSMSLVTEAQLSSNDCATYSETAEIIYKYISLTTEPEREDVTELCQRYPDTPKRAIISLKWCNDHKIISGSVDREVYEQWKDPVTRYHIAAFLERLYIYGYID